MKIALFTNFMNHHQLQLCNRLNEITQENFVLVVNQKTPLERLNLGYEDLNKTMTYIIFDNKENSSFVNELLISYDVVIFGNCNIKNIIKRSKTKKLTFYYTERLFKRDLKGIESIIFKLKTIIKHKFLNKNMFLLCAGGFVKDDFNKLGLYSKRSLKWGYFPELIYKNQSDLQRFDNQILEIIWVGRMIDWKRPSVVLDIINKWKEDIKYLRLTMYGDGPLRNKLLEYIDEYNLKEYVNLQGAISFSEVRAKMDKSHIFIFTSDKQEGWGAVLNEAMNSMLVTFSYNEIGSVPYLVKDGINGFIYENINDIKEILIKLSNDRKMSKEIAYNAYHTIESQWNAKTAADRLLILAREYYQGKDILNLFEDGPLSKA